MCSMVRDDDAYSENTSLIDVLILMEARYGSITDVIGSTECCQFGRESSF